MCSGGSEAERDARSTQNLATRVSIFNRYLFVLSEHLKRKNFERRNVLSLIKENKEESTKMCKKSERERDCLHDHKHLITRYNYITLVFLICLHTV